MTTQLGTPGRAVDHFGDVARSMVDAGVEALQAALGSAVSASPPRVDTQLDTRALAGAAVARSMLTGAGVSGGLVTVAPGGGLAVDAENAVDPAALIDVLAGGAATALSRVSGVSLQPAPGEALPAEPGVAGLGEHVVMFTLDLGAGAAAVTWIIESSLAALIAGNRAESAPAGVSPAALPELGHGVPSGRQRDLHLLADVPMNVTVELGRAVMQVRDLLSLESGSIVELDRTAGAAVDVLVNGTLVAKGEVVVVDDKLGVRVTEIVER